MFKQTLSTQEVSSLLNVTETTVKRWADDGKIPCMKTPGKHRKFLVNDIIKFAEDNAYKLTGVLTPPAQGEHGDMLQFAVQTQNYAKISEHVYDYALTGDRKRVVELLSYLIRHHLPLTSILDEVIRPALYRIGVQWMEGLLDIDSEHLASNTIKEALGLAQREVYHKQSNGLHVVCACGEGEWHEIGIRGIGYVFESEGWKVSFVGADTPYESLATFVDQHKPNLVMLSLLANPHERISGIRAVGKAVHRVGGKIMIGGPWAGKTTEADLGCDAIGASAADALELAKDIFSLRRGPKKKNERITSG